MKKKVIALVLACSMVFSSFTAAFADTAIPADAQAAKNLGMLVGSGSGVTPEYLNEQPSRIQSAIMFLRLKGLYETAVAFKGTENFADAKDMQWAEGKNILAYLKANPSLGFIGTGANMFNANEKIDAKSYYKVMLEALGYKQNTAEIVGDFTWNDVLTFAASKGLTKVANDANFQVADIATATIETLKANVKGGTKTLAASLVEAGVINEAAAIAAGVYTKAPVALAVKSVTASNLIQAVVEFNATVDKETAEDETLYTIEGITVEKAALQADGKTVVLSLDDATLFTNGEEYTIEIAEDIVETSVKFTVVDSALPVAQSVKLTGPNTFDVIFSEPIDSNSTVVVEMEDGIYGATAVADDTNVVEVTMGTSSLEAGNYKVVVSGAKDFTGGPALRKTFTLNYVKDTTAPTPVIVSADQTEVVLDFGKVVTDEDGNAIDETYFYHSYTSYQPDSVTWDGSEVTLVFTTNPLPEGNVKIVVDYDANNKVITDLWGNEMKSNAVLTATITADTTKPVVTKIEVTNEDIVKVYFSENVTEADAEDVDNYVVKQNGKEIDESFAATYDADDKMVTLDFSDDLDGAYTMEISNITDDAYVANEMAKVTVAFNVKDITGINLNEIEIEAVDGNTNDTLIVRFPDDMAGTGLYSALNKANYQVSFDNGVTFDNLETADTIAFFNGNDTVKITIADEDAYAVETLAAAGNLEVMISRLADSDGNLSTKLGATVTAAQVTTPEIDTVKMTGYKTVEVTFDGVIVSAPADGFVISDDNNATTGTAASVSLAKNKDGNTVATLTLKSAQQLATKATSFTAGNVEVSIAANKVKADTGTFAAAAGANLRAEATDGIKPVYDDMAVAYAGGNAEITITFSEAIADVNETLAAFDLIVKDADGEELVAGVDYTTAIVGGNLVIVIEDVADATDYTVATKATVNYVKDAAGNKATAFTAKDVE